MNRFSVTDARVPALPDPLPQIYFGGTSWRSMARGGAHGVVGNHEEVAKLPFLKQKGNATARVVGKH
jgi:hypothetical protein